MKRELIEQSLYTNDCLSNLYSYEEYKEYCKDMEKEVYPENSDPYWEWVSERDSFWWEELMVGLDVHCNFPCIITGSVGTWRGRFDIYQV